MTAVFECSLSYISLSASFWDYELMRMARYVRRSEVNLRPYSPEGLRLVRGATDLDRQFERRLDKHGVSRRGRRTNASKRSLGEDS